MWEVSCANVLVSWHRVQQSEFCDRLWITSRKPLKLRYNFIGRCSKADYPHNQHNRKCGIKELSLFRQWTGWYMEYRRNSFNRPITLLSFMISVKNQNPLSRSGLKNESRKSRDIQSPSRRRCELKCADSRAVTKRGLFDCEPAHTADRMVQCDKTTCAQWAKEAKCNIQNCFHLWHSVNEN